MFVLGGFRVLRGRGIKSVCNASFRIRDRGMLKEAYLENRGGLGFGGLESVLVGGLMTLMSMGW